MYSKIYLLFLFFSFLSLSLLAQKEKKVLFIGVDGCRGDVLREIPTPNIDRLTKKAVFSYDALNEGITISGPGWSNLFTGVRHEKHKVVGNDFKSPDYDNYPDFISRAKEEYPDLETASFYTWLEIGLITRNVDTRIARKYSQDGDAFIHTIASDYLENEKADITSVYYGDVDIAGHTYGFDSEVNEYYDEIIQFDRYVGDLMDAIESRDTRSDEEWLIAISTDHGGYGKGHGGITLQERNIFVIVSGDLFSKPKEISRDQGAIEISPADPLEIRDIEKYGYLNTPRQTDIAPTILDFLVVGYGEGDFDGTSLIRD